jgi:catechol 2,3-dioxygenase-like lactoylglutathione lyase family enzyme
MIEFQSAVPQFTVQDVVRTAEYYREVLGFEIDGYWADPPVFAIVRRGAVQVFFSLARGSEVRTGRPPGAYDAYFYVTEVDALANELRGRGAEIVEGPVTRMYPQRELVVRECNALVLTFGESVPG